MLLGETLMNKDILGGFTRHVITVLAGAIIANGTADINVAVGTLMQNLASGETSALIGSGVAIFAILWSMWVKFAEETKQVVVNSLTFKK
jgi:hypothetical protein